MTGGHLHLAVPRHATHAGSLAHGTVPFQSSVRDAGDVGRRLRPSGLGNFQLFSRRKARTEALQVSGADCLSMPEQVGPNQNPNEAECA